MFSKLSISIDSNCPNIAQNLRVPAIIIKKVLLIDMSTIVDSRSGHCRVFNHKAVDNQHVITIVVFIYCVYKSFTKNVLASETQ